MVKKITTYCSFVGSETIHFVEMDDDATEEDIRDYANEAMINDIEPGYSIEDSDEEEAEQEGYEIE